MPANIQRVLDYTETSSELCCSVIAYGVYTGISLSCIRMGIGEAARSKDGALGGIRQI